MKKRPRHRVTRFLLGGFLRVFLRLKFNYKAKRFRPTGDTRGPYLIMSNHVMAMDPILVSMSFKEPIFFVASDMIFSIPFVSPIIRFLASPIPKSKYRSDTATIRDIKKMVKSGGSIGLFPEGNATFSGQTMEIVPSTAKLVKFLKIPVVFYNIERAYFAKPRWGKRSRKGKVDGLVKKVWHYEEYKDLSLEEITKEIRERLHVNHYELQMKEPVAFKGKKKAEDLESTFFYCPNCESFGTLLSKGDEVSCSSCEFTVTYDVYGFFRSDNNYRAFETTIPWYIEQKEALSTHLKNHKQGEIIFTDDDEAVYIVERAAKRTFIGHAALKLDHRRIHIECHDGRNEQLSIDSISVAVQQKNKLIIHSHETGKTYYLLNHPKRNALKYELAVTMLQNKED